MRYENLQYYDDKVFKYLTGVNKDLFAQMVDALKYSESLKKKQGRPHTLSLADQVLMTLNYLKTYKTQMELASIYGLSDSNVHRTIVKVENALIGSGLFNLPKRNITPNHIQTKQASSDYAIIDVTECPIERPKKSKDITQRRYYSGKQKQYTLSLNCLKP